MKALLATAVCLLAFTVAGCDGEHYVEVRGGRAHLKNGETYTCTYNYVEHVKISDEEWFDCKRTGLNARLMLLRRAWFSHKLRAGRIR